MRAQPQSWGLHASGERGQENQPAYPMCPCGKEDGYLGFGYLYRGTYFGERMPEMLRCAKAKRKGHSPSGEVISEGEVATLPCFLFLCGVMKPE